MRTWYRIAGDLGSGKIPLLLLHGGPGWALMCSSHWRPSPDAAQSCCHHAATKIKRPDRLLAIRPLTGTYW
jgi:hypothetical protein